MRVLLNPSNQPMKQSINDSRRFPESFGKLHVFFFFLQYVNFLVFLRFVCFFLFPRQEEADVADALLHEALARGR